MAPATSSRSAGTHTRFSQATIAQRLSNFNVHQRIETSHLCGLRGIQKKSRLLTKFNADKFVRRFLLRSRISFSLLESLSKAPYSEQNNSVPSRYLDK